MVQTAAQKKAEDARAAQAKRSAKLTPREFEETHERGADGGLECNRRRTNIAFKNVGTNNVTVDLSNCGLEHTLTDPANLTADQKPTEAMYDVVRHYLRMSFTGEIGSGVIKSHSRTVNPWMLWAALVKAYHQEDEESSQAELEYIFEQFPLMRQILERKPRDNTPLFRIEPGTGDEIPVTEATRLDELMGQIITEYRQYQILKADEKPEDRMDQVHIDRLPTAERIHEAIIKDPTIISLEYMLPRDLEELKKCKVAFPEDNTQDNRPYRLEDKIANPTWEFSSLVTIAEQYKTYRKHQKILDDGAKDGASPTKPVDRIAGTTYAGRQGNKDTTPRVGYGECADYMTGGADGKGCNGNGKVCPRNKSHPPGRFNTIEYKDRATLQAEYEGRMKKNAKHGKGKGKQPYHKGKRPNNPDIICYGCGKKGHPRHRCPEASSEKTVRFATKGKADDAAKYTKKEISELVVAGVKAAMTDRKRARKRSASTDGYDESVLDLTDGEEAEVENDKPSSAKKTKKSGINAFTLGKGGGWRTDSHTLLMACTFAAVLMSTCALGLAEQVISPNCTRDAKFNSTADQRISQLDNSSITFTTLTPSLVIMTGLILVIRRAYTKWRGPITGKYNRRPTEKGRKRTGVFSKRKYSNLHVVTPYTRAHDMVWQSPLVWRNSAGYEIREVGSLVPDRKKKARASVRQRLIATLRDRKRKAGGPALDAGTDLPVFDSGANINGTGNPQHFHTMRYFSQPQVIRGAGGTKHQVLGIGSVRFKTKDTDGHEYVVQFDGVRYAPDLTSLYIDTTELRKRDWTVEGGKRHITWTTPSGVQLPLAEIDGNEVLQGTFMSRIDTENHRINGFVSKSFRERIQDMTVQDLTTEVDEGGLNRWQDHHARLHLAKKGTLVVDKEAPSEWLRVHHSLGHPPARVTAAHCRKYGIALSQVENKFCEACLAAGQKKKPRGKRRKISERPKPLTKFSCDVWGPTKQKSGPKGARWILMYVDHGTDECFSYPLAHLRDIPARTAEFLADVRAGRRTAGEIDVELPVTMHSDSASYFRSAAMAQVAQQMNTTLSFSPPETQSKNGKIERSFGLIGQRALALLIAAGLPESDWLYAWLYANQLHTRTVRNGDKDATSPYEKRHKTAPGDVTKTHLPFGARCSAWQPKQQRDGKLGARARLGVVLGYDDSTQAPIVRVTTKTGKKVLRVTAQWRLDPRLPPGVYEAGPLLPDLKGEGEEEQSNPVIQMQPEEERVESAEDRATARNKEAYVPPQELLAPNGGQQEGGLNFEGQEAELENEIIEDGPESEATLAPGEAEQPKQYDTVEVLPGTGYRLVAGIRTNATEGVGIAPEKPEVERARTKGVAYSLKTAIRIWPGYEKALRKAAKVEIDGLRNMCLEPIPQDEFTEEDRVKMTTLSTLYSLKWEGELFSKGKMRAVFRGEQEVKDEDYIESSTTVPRLSSIRAFLAMTPREGVKWGSLRMDVSQAYLKAELEPIPANNRRVIGLPADVTPRWPNGEPVRFKLTHSLYGMHSAGKMWEEKMAAYLKYLGFTRNAHEPNLWKKGDLHVVVYVDDLAVRGPQAQIDWFAKEMAREFGNVKPKPLDFLLGVHIVHDIHTGSLGMHSASYIDGMVATEGMDNLKGRELPLPPGTRITSTQRDKVPCAKRTKEYQRILGQVSYLATWTHPDLSYPMSALASVASAPTGQHLKMLKRTVGYLKSTGRSLGLKWLSPLEMTDLNNKIKTTHEEAAAVATNTSPNPPPIQWEPNVLQVWADASWAQEDNSCSQSGFVAMMNGGPVHWYSKRQEFAALSSTEAEIMAAVTALRYTLHMKAMLEDMGLPQGAIRIHVDAMNAIRYCTEEKISQRNHHIGVRYHRMRHHVKVGDVEVVFCRTVDMLADTATKNAAEEQFKGVIDTVMHDFGADACQVETAK